MQADESGLCDESGSCHEQQKQSNIAPTSGSHADMLLLLSPFRALKFSENRPPISVANKGRWMDEDTIRAANFFGGASADGRDDGHEVARWEVWLTMTCSDVTL